MTSQPGEVTLPLPRPKNDQHEVNNLPELGVDIIDSSQLCGAIANRWAIIRGQNSQLISPYFDIEFTKAVARVRSDVEIAIIKNSADEIVGFLPYQRVGRNHAEPVGGRLNDVHGMIAGPDTSRHRPAIARAGSIGRADFGV